MDIILYKVAEGYVINTSNGIIHAAIGRNGLVTAQEKREGDSKTPIGTWKMRAIFFRPDRITLPQSQLPITAITQDMGWCDDAQSSYYNQQIGLPFSASHEKMWREDSAYDIVIPLGYNDDPPQANRGSAIFFHLLHEGKNYTAGCVAINLQSMLHLIPELTSESHIKISS